MCKVQIGSRRGLACLVKDRISFGYSKPNNERGIHVFEDDKYILISDSQLINKKGDIEDERLIRDAYDKYGKNSPEHLEGVFVYVLWDKKKGTLFIARDRLGQKPIFYYVTDSGDFIFASTTKGILGSDLVKKDLDLEAIYHFLFMKSFEQPRTPIKGLKSLLPGHFLIFKDGKITSGRYWDIEIKINNSISENEAIDEISKLIFRSIENCCKDLIPSKVGVLLSGGIDSSYLVAILSQYFDEPIKTFHVHFDKEGRADDESDYANIVSEKFRTKHTNIKLTADFILNNLTDMVWNTNTPIANSGFKLSVVAPVGMKDGVEFYLLGEGADTIFGLSEAWRYYEMLESILFFLPLLDDSSKNRFYRLGRDVSHGLMNFSDSMYIKGLFYYFCSRLGYFKWKGSTITEEEVRNLFNKSNFDPEKMTSIGDLYQSIFKSSKADKIIEQYTYTALKTYTPNQQLIHYASICSAYKSTPIFPFLDIQLMEYCLKVPFRLKNKEGVKKYLLKNISKKCLPAQIINRKKKAFILPFGHWLENELKPLVDYVFSKETIEKRGVFSYMEMSKLYYRFYTRKDASWVDIWSFVILELWLQMFFDADEMKKPNENIFDYWNLKGT